MAHSRDGHSRVTIVAASPTVGGSREAVSDAEGFYRLTNLPPGEYSLTVALQGFARFLRPGVVVRAGLNLSLDIALKVGTLAENPFYLGAQNLQPPRVAQLSLCFTY